MTRRTEEPYGRLSWPRVSEEMLRLITTGDVFSLSLPLSSDVPRPDGMVGYDVAPAFRHGELSHILPASAEAETVTMSTHVGTHIDALCHIGEHDPERAGRVVVSDGRGGTRAVQGGAPIGAETGLGIDAAPPIVCRGIMLDVPPALGVDALQPGHAISRREIESTIDLAGTPIREGDAVVVRTGSYAAWRARDESYCTAVAGLSLEAAEFLADSGIGVIGADNLTVEALPPSDHSVHRLNLVKHGIMHIENLFLEELSASQVYRFLFIACPLPLEGATGSWLSPLAIA